MLLTIQIIGIIFGIGMAYATYIYLRRKDLRVIDAVFWFIVWIGLILLLFFSNSMNVLLESLQIHRAMDLFMMLGFLVMTMVIFYLYVSFRHLNKRIERLIRKIAIKKATKTNK